MPSFLQSYGSTSYPQGTQPPELEDKNEKQNAVPIN